MPAEGTAACGREPRPSRIVRGGPPPPDRGSGRSRRKGRARKSGAAAASLGGRPSPSGDSIGRGAGSNLDLAAQLQLLGVVAPRLLDALLAKEPSLHLAAR